MGSELLIRAFDVEVGDCFYVRIPDARLEDGERSDFHLLVDCGSRGSKAVLHRALAGLRELLPEVDGFRRLDLLVVTHEHSDHIKGFDPEDFDGIRIGAIWLSAAMDPNHPQAERSRALHQRATLAMRGLAASGLAMSPEIRELVALYGIDNDGAMDALTRGLPSASGITTRFVHSESPESELELPLDGAAVRVLGPDPDIDRFYLGEGAEHHLALAASSVDAAPVAGATGDVEQPANISPEDFRRLRSRMLSNALAFAELDSKVRNNTSLMLLIEWRGRRLLFVGDAEWEERFHEGHHNGGWNVAWHTRRDELARPVDFLKIGHHGSTNSTPWAEGGLPAESEPVQILDAVLPPSRRDEAQAVVSTRRKNYKTIPRAELLVEIGRRVGNTRRYGEALAAKGVEVRDLPYFETHEAQWIEEPQPARTDFETELTGRPWVDVLIEPASS